MEEARKLDLRPLLALAGAVAVLVAIWATGAFGAGGSSSGNHSSSDPGAAFVQSQNAQPTPGDDCPGHQNGGGGGGSDGGSGGSGSGSGDL